MGTKEGEEAMEEMARFLSENKPDLTVNRLPEPHLSNFKKLAKEKYANDYGMTIVTLMTKVELFDMFAPAIDETVEKMNEVIQDVEVLKEAVSKLLGNKQVKAALNNRITSVDGTIIRGIGEKKEDE